MSCLECCVCLKEREPAADTHGSDAELRRLPSTANFTEISLNHDNDYMEPLTCDANGSYSGFIKAENEQYAAAYETVELEAYCIIKVTETAIVAETSASVAEGHPSIDTSIEVQVTSCCVCVCVCVCV